MAVLPPASPATTASRANGLDRASFVPLYFQLAEILKERIEGGHWQPGDRFPSEGELRDEFGISRTVIRPALALLESDGQLVRIKGRGTFVAPPKRIVRIAGLTRLLAQALPAEFGLRVVEVRDQRPEAAVEQLLGTGSARVTHVTAVASFQERPLFICDSFCPPADVPWLRPALLRRRLLGPGTGPLGEIHMGHTDVRLDVAYVSHWEAAQLGLAAGQACYLIRALEHGAPAAGDEPRVVEFARLVYPVDTVQFASRLDGADGPLVASA